MILWSSLNRGEVAPDVVEELPREADYLRVDVVRPPPPRADLPQPRLHHRPEAGRQEMHINILIQNGDYVTRLLRNKFAVYVASFLNIFNVFLSFN